MLCHIFQDGRDGFGHQLEGFFNCLIIHGINNNYFDGVAFKEKNFEFEHVNENQSKLLKEYLIEIINQFINHYKQEKIIYKTILRSHEYINIPKNYESDILYSLDNIFSFKKIFTDKDSIEKIKENIDILKLIVINDKLPLNRLDKKNIVIHIRLGDALTTGRGNSIFEYNFKILKLIDILKKKYPEHTYYIHSDGNPDEIINKIGSNYFFYNKDTPVLEVLSDFIYSSIFICGNSSLSVVSSFFGNKELIIVNDDNDHSLPDNNTHFISTYLENNLNIKG